MAATSLLPVAPRPFAGELVSSWLGRTAACYDVSVADLRQALCPADQPGRSRPDVDWDPAEAVPVAERLRFDPRAAIDLTLRCRWPGLAVDWLPSTDGTGRARDALDLAWCGTCLAEAHEAGGSYLDGAAALPLVFCHRHRSWRQDFCRRCRPRHAPRFVRAGTIEFACSDCGIPLRTSRRPGPTPAIDIEPEEASAAFLILLCFDSEVFKALLGRPARLIGVGLVAARQFLAVLKDLTRALLAPSLFGTSLINHFDSPLLPAMRAHAPQTWDEQPYQELSPLERAWVLSAVVASLADEPVSRLMSGARRPPRAYQNLEWLLVNAAGWVQAMLIRHSVGWPEPLRGRVEAHRQRTGMDVDVVLAQFKSWRVERAQRLHARTSLIG